MRVGWISLHSFRSYQSLEWSPQPEVNLLIGPNGAGKTNLLEAVAYLSTLSSFRGAPTAALVADGEEAAVIRAGVERSSGESLIEIELPRQGNRRVQVNKSRLRRGSELLGVLRVITFLPEDLDLVKRGPAHRRDLLDQVAVQLWPSAHLDQTELERSLRQRNAFLKSGAREETTLSVWDSRLALAGGKVVARRARVMAALADLFRTGYASLAQDGADAAITYTASWGDWGEGDAEPGEYAAVIEDALGRARRADYERRTTTVGPHRDEPGFTINDRSARTHGSQGEQRTLALAVKLAAHAAVAKAVGEPPVLLLDDVFSELDEERGSALARSLPPHTQTIITSARGGDVPVTGVVWKVADGVWA